MSGALDNYKQMPIGTTIGTSYAKVLDAPVGVNAHDLVVTNLDFSATVTIALTSAPGDASTVPQVEVPAGTSRTIRNVPSQAGADVYAKATAPTALVSIGQSPPTDAAWR